MGRSYWFECSKCGYRAKVSGRAERGLDFAIQTILCRDCKQLYDAVVRLRIADSLKERSLNLGFQKQNAFTTQRLSFSPPSFEAVLNRLPPRGVKYFRWLRFKPQCPISPYHRVEEWNAPAKCPQCGVHLEQNAIPYRLWD